MADSTCVFTAEALSLSVSPTTQLNNDATETHSTVIVKTPKKRGRKRKTDKGTTPAEESDGPPPVKRGRGRPPRSAQTNIVSAEAEEGEGANAARERSRVKTLRDAFLELQRSLPSVPPDTKLSKLDVLVLATTYISYLMKTLDDGDSDRTNKTKSTISEKHHRLKTHGLLHPVKKWPMRSRLYAGAGGFPLPSALDTVSPPSTSI